MPVTLHSIASAALERRRNHSHSINEKTESHRNSVVCVITIHWKVRDEVLPKLMTLDSQCIGQWSEACLGTGYEWTEIIID